MVVIPLLLSYMSFTAFPESNDAILAHERKDMIKIETSGSMGLYHGGKCKKTYGNETIISDEYQEWCSNIVKETSDQQHNPFIQYSIRGKQMRVKKYAIRNGCCRYDCCCDEEGKVMDYYCCCMLYSYSLLASNDNRTWVTLHKIEKDKSFHYCASKTYDIERSIQPFTYFRFVLDEEWPNCPKCMQINQIELYGDTVHTGYMSYSEDPDEDESITIIGRIRRNEDRG